MFSRSLQAKFILPVSVLVVVVTLILVAAISISNSRSIEQSAQNESQEKLSNIVQILSITDANRMEGVKGSMKLLIERGSAIGVARQGNPVEVEGKMPPDLILAPCPRATASNWWMA